MAKVHSEYLAKLTDEQRSDLIKRLLAVQGGVCYLCEKKIDLDLDKDDLDIDHIKPLNPEHFEQKGEDNENNMAVTHLHCNRAKSNKSVALYKSILKIKNLEEQRKEVSLKDILEVYGGSKKELKYSISDNIFKYKIGNENYSTQIFTDELSGEKSCFVQLPIEYLFHDNEMNPRTLNASVTKLVEEFYYGNPQLHSCLATIKNGKVSIFDGQHKAVAQVVLGVKSLLVRIFIEPNLQRLNSANVKAGKELCQIQFSSIILSHLKYNEYQDLIVDYRKKHKLDDDNYNFSEQDICNANSLKTTAKTIIAALKWDITSNDGNKLSKFMDKTGRGTGVGKAAPLSYNTFEKAFLNVLIDGNKIFSENLDKSPRQQEANQLIRLCNIIAETICINKYDDTIDIKKVEDAVLNGQDANISDEHLVCTRLCREAFFAAMIYYVQEVIEYHFKNVEMNAYKGNDKKNYFTYEFSEELWTKIKNFLEKFADLPVWKWRKSNQNIQIFKGTAMTKDQVVQGLSNGVVNGVTLLPKPININDMINK